MRTEPNKSAIRVHQSFFILQFEADFLTELIYSNCTERLKLKIVVLGGGGHVGLPLCLVLANTGHDVIALDSSSTRVEMINNGVMPFLENGAQDILIDVLLKKKFLASLDYEVLRNAELIIVVIGTPVDEHLNPNPNEVLKLIKSCIKFLKSGQLLMLRSTLFPGVSEQVQEILISEGLRIEVAFCPERILEGEAVVELQSLPQIVGADSDLAYTRASGLFLSLGVEVVRLSLKEAELAKLFTNVWRYIKFATANQFWVMANDSGVDFSRVRTALTYNYPRAKDLPNAGFTAGPCLFKDTMQLGAFSNNNFQLGHAAMLVNEGIPLNLVRAIEKKHDLSLMTVGILGMAFKAESDDVRSSLSYKLKKILQFKAKQVLTTDPYVKSDPELLSIEEVLSRSDIIIIGAPHEIFKDIEFVCPVIDVWDFLGKGNLV